IDGLFRFASEPLLREEHADHLRLEALHIGAPLDAHPDFDHEVHHAYRNLKDLRSWSTEVEGLRPWRDQLAERADQHTAVVYLVQLPEDIRPHLTYSQSMGLQ